jgi:hypothetical protein
MYHGDFWRHREGRTGAKDVERSPVAARGPLGARTACEAENAAQDRSGEVRVNETRLRTRECGSESLDGQK